MHQLAQAYDESTAFKAVREWSDFCGLIDDRVLDHFKPWSDSLRIALLTNGTTRLDSDLVKLGVKDRFFKIFNSADIGLCKPDNKIFQHVVDELGCETSEILFVDDSEFNVQAAQYLGLQTYHYKSFEKFQRLSLNLLSK